MGRPRKHADGIDEVRFCSTHGETAHRYYNNGKTRDGRQDSTWRCLACKRGRYTPIGERV